jgi:ATP-dependent exoDNAse (exonuclease V) beta subunit
MSIRVMDKAAQQTATELQRAALDARASVYISANAGTGKTEVLTTRIIALLLANFELSPSHILGLTFTKAAAAEMATRLAELLHEWNAKADDALREKLQEVFGLDITPQLLKRFRQLPALVADAPPTLTTIHGFAQQLLGRLSESDGLPQPFELVEDAAQLGLLPAALARAVHHANEGEQQALDKLLEELGDNGWRDLSGLFEHNWQAFLEVVQHNQDHFEENLQQALCLFTPEKELEKQLLPTPEELTALCTFAPTRGSPISSPRVATARPPNKASLRSRPTSTPTPPPRKPCATPKPASSKSAISCVAGKASA